MCKTDKIAEIHFSNSLLCHLIASCNHFFSKTLCPVSIFTLFPRSRSSRAQMLKAKPHRYPLDANEPMNQMIHRLQGGRPRAVDVPGPRCAQTK